MREAVALKRWLAEQDPPLANEIFLDIDPDSGLRTGTRWKDALRRANARCEAVICLLSRDWEASHECKVEYRTAENLNKQILVARLEPSTGDELTSEWQRCDLFGDGPTTSIDTGGGPPVEFSTEGLYRLRDGIRGAGIGADSFVWPPPSDPERAPYRGWEPLETTDAAIFFGRDAQILRALDAIRGMRLSGVNSLFVVLGPSGTGKSSFLRAGLLPRLRREDRRFLVMDIVRPERNVLSGESGLAASVFATRKVFGLTQPSLGEIKAMCQARDVTAISALFAEARTSAAARLLDRGDGAGGALQAPTLVLPLDQAEELFSADAGESADAFLELLAGVVKSINATEVGLVVAATIRTDRFEVMQTHPRLAEVGSVLFDELKPMPPTQFKEVIVGPAARATDSGRPLRIAPELVDRLLQDAGQGADTLPMLALTLSRLYVDYGASGELALAHYESLGGMRRVVQTEIDDVLSCEPGQRRAQLDALRAAFIPWLATINPDSDQPMRRVARWSDLPESSRALIDALVSKRLMVKDTRGGQIVVEVALESLLRQWDELAGWLRDERKELKDADDLERGAAAWEANRQNPEWLLEGSRLQEATALVNKPSFRQRLVGVHPYLTASHERENQRRAAEDQRRHAELQAAQERAHHAQERATAAQELQATAEAHTATLRKRSRVMRAVLAGTAIVAVLAVAASVFGFVSRGQAQDRFRQATGVRLVSEAQAMFAGSRPGGDVRAIHQLLAAAAITGQPDRDALYDAVVQEAALSKVITNDQALCPAAFSPDGRLVAAGNADLDGGDGSIRIWDVETGQPHGDVLSGHQDVVNAVVFSPDGTELASASVDGTVRIWNVETGQQDGDPLEVGDSATDVFFSRDGIQMATLSWEGDVQVWDTKTRERVGEPLLGGVEKVAFTPDRQRVAASDDDGNIAVVDMSSGKLITEITRDAALTVLQLSPDGRQVMSAGPASPLELWDAETGQPIDAPAAGGQYSTFVVAAAFSPDGRLIASGTNDSAVQLWDNVNGQFFDVPLPGPAGLTLGVSFDPDGKRLAVSGSDGTLWIFEVPSALPLPGRAVAFRPDGTLAVGAENGTVQMWEPATREALNAPSKPAEGVARMAFSQDGRQLVSTSTEGALQFRDPDTGALSGRPVDGGGFLGPVAFSADGQVVVTGTADGGVRLWDSQTRRPRGKPFEDEDSKTVAVAFAADGGTVAAVDLEDPAGQLVVWDTDTGERVSETPLTSGALAGALGPGLVAGTGGIDGYVTFYEPETGDAKRKPVRGHGSYVTAMAFGADGARAATGGGTTVRLWDAGTGETIGQALRGPRDSVIDVVISPDGRYIAAATFNNEVWLWPASASPDDLCAKLTTNMSQKQWDDWVSPDIDYIKTCPALPVPPS